jgi:CRISPR type IV-associated protein Csf3
MHLDSLLAHATVANALGTQPPFEGQTYEVLGEDLPLERHFFENGQWVWQASMMHTIGFKTQARRYLTCRTPVQAMHEAVGSGWVSPKGGSLIDTSRGFAKNGQTYYTTEFSHGLVGWCVGDYDQITYLLSTITAVGGKRRLGMGALREYEDGSCFKVTPLDAAQTLWMRRASPVRLIEESIMVMENTKPPYFDRTRRVPCWIPRDCRVNVG